MKTFKKAVVMAGMIAVMIIFSVYNTYAADTSRDITVSYMPDKAYQKVILSVEAAGKGSIADGDSLIREGTVLYELQEEDTKLFKILPDQGWQIEKAVLNDGYEETDILGKIKDSEVEIKVKDKNAGLTVVFQKIPKNSEGSLSGSSSAGQKNHSTGGGNIKGIKTGDQTNALVWLVILTVTGAALGQCILLKKRKKKQDDETHMPC